MHGRGGTGRAEHYSNIGEEMKTAVKVGKIKECVLFCNVFSVYSTGAALRKALFLTASSTSIFLPPLRCSKAEPNLPALHPSTSSPPSVFSPQLPSLLHLIFVPRLLSPASSALTSSSHPSFLMPVVGGSEVVPTQSRRRPQREVASTAVGYQPVINYSLIPHLFSVCGEK